MYGVLFFTVENCYKKVLDGELGMDQLSVFFTSPGSFKVVTPLQFMTDQMRVSDLLENGSWVWICLMYFSVREIVISYQVFQFVPLEARI